MKVGILTFHRAVNYGAVLQAWALQTFLKNNGYETYIVDYRCGAVENNYKLFSWQKIFHQSIIVSIKYILSRIYHYKSILKRKKVFNTFLSSKLNLISLSAVNDIDVLITGSDQVWNPYLTGGMDKYYFLDIPAFSDKKKIAYAVSGEKKFFSDDYVEKIKPAISHINNLSVREANLREVLNLNKAEVCVDPTFLLTNSEWENLGIKRIISSEYIFLFEVVPSPVSKKIAKALSEKYNIEIIYLYSGFKFLKKNTNINSAIGPEEFVSLIRYSHFVVTTSFHGMAMSILLRKQFVLAPTTHMNRQISLLRQIGLENRIVKSHQELELLKTIKYTDEMFVKMSSFSQDFLLSSLDYGKNINVI